MSGAAADRRCCDIVEAVERAQLDGAETMLGQPRDHASQSWVKRLGNPIEKKIIRPCLAPALGTACSEAGPPVSSGLDAASPERAFGRGRPGVASPGGILHNGAVGPRYRGPGTNPKTNREFTVKA